jgi:hypothetical protein
MKAADPFPRPIRVAVIAHDERVRTSVRHLLASGGGAVMEVYAADPRPATLFGAFGADTDVVVLDLDPATATSHPEQLRGLPAGVPAVVLGNDRVTAEVARAAGAVYLDKADAANQLLHSVLLAADPSRATDR